MRKRQEENRGGESSRRETRKGEGRSRTGGIGENKEKKREEMRGKKRSENETRQDERNMSKDSLWTLLEQFWEAFGDSLGTEV